MKNAAVIYTRVSSDEQVNNMSLGEQERICRDYIAHKPENLIVDRIFIEEGESAKTAERTKLKEMLEYCRANKNKVGHLVVYKIDRFARSVEDHMALQVLLKKMDIVLWSATEPIGVTTTGKLMEHVLASFAEFDNSVRSERCRNGLVARAEEGGWVSHAPVGYVNTKDELKRPTLAYDDKMVKNVQHFFNEFASGKYIQSEAIALAEKCGIRTAQGNVMSKNGVINMLTSITYAGYVQNALTDNKRVKGLHPSIIPLEQYLAVQAILKGNKRKIETLTTRLKQYWPMKRFLTCSLCGQPLSGSTSKGRFGKPYSAYHCTKCTKRRNGATVRLPKAKAHEDFGALLDSLVPSEWALKVFKEIVIRRWNQDFRDVQSVRRKLDAEIATLEERKNELFDRWMAGRIKDDKVYEAQNDRITVQKETLELERAELKSDETDKERVVDEAVHFMAHAREIWDNAQVLDKVRFQKLVFATGIPVYPNQTFGTTEPSVIYVQLTTIEKQFENNIAELPTENSAMVQGVGFEPTKANAN
jgi:site-specific DNA recombinase